MASGKRMMLNKIERIKRQQPAETRSRARRNRMRNYLREQDVKEQMKEEANATLQH